jgi:hypothetical protein
MFVIYSMNFLAFAISIIGLSVMNINVLSQLQTNMPTSLPTSYPISSYPTSMPTEYLFEVPSQSPTESPTQIYSNNSNKFDMNSVYMSLFIIGIIICGVPACYIIYSKIQQNFFSVNNNDNNDDNKDVFVKKPVDKSKSAEFHNLL